MKTEISRAELTEELRLEFSRNAVLEMLAEKRRNETRVIFEVTSEMTKVAGQVISSQGKAKIANGTTLLRSMDRLKTLCHNLIVERDHLELRMSNLENILQNNELKINELSKEIIKFNNSL